MHFDKRYKRSSYCKSAVAKYDNYFETLVPFLKTFGTSTKVTSHHIQFSTHIDGTLTGRTKSMGAEKRLNTFRESLIMQTSGPHTLPVPVKYPKKKKN